MHGWMNVRHTTKQSSNKDINADIKQERRRVSEEVRKQSIKQARK